MKNLVQVLDINDKKRMGQEMSAAGVHKDGISIMSGKAVFRAVKIKSIPVTSANIIKQEMLARGGDAATAYGAVDHSVKSTDIIVFGTDLQFESLIKKLKSQYFGLKDIALDMKEAIGNFSSFPGPIRIGKRTLNFSKRTYIMAILNVTPDSFSDGGQFFDEDTAVEHALRMARDGADIIDVGGESTRPGAASVSERTELSRVVPVIKRIRKHSDVAISIDTTKARVADVAIKAGANMINDVSGANFDSRIAKVAARHKVPLILMHMQGKPRTMQKSPRYDDLIPDIIFCLKKSVELAIKGGAPEGKIIIDPGIGFGKTTEHNLEILRRLREFTSLGLPLLVGVSRKSVIGNVLKLPVGERMEGTGAAVTAAVLNGANIVRVHDVMEMKRAAGMADAILRS